MKKRRLFPHRSHTIHYFNQRVLDEILSWPAGVVADFARLIELQMRVGPAPWAPHARQVIGALTELRPSDGGGNSARVYVCPIEGNEIVVLDAFQRPPGDEARMTETALRRMQGRARPHSGYRPVPHDHPAFLAAASELAGFADAYEALWEAYLMIEVLLAARVRAGLTQEQVAQAMGTTASAVSRLERGDGKHSPSLSTLRAYADAVGCELELVLRERPAPRP